MIRRQKRLASGIPVAAMSDIAFLLVIFFMVTSNFIKERHVKLAPPSSSDIQRIKQSQVSVAVDNNGKLWLQGKACPPNVLTSAVSAMLADKKDKLVTLKVDKNLTEKDFYPTLMALSDAGAQIALVGTKE